MAASVEGTDVRCTGGRPTNRGLQRKVVSHSQSAASLLCAQARLRKGRGVRIYFPRFALSSTMVETCQFICVSDRDVHGNMAGERLTVHSIELALMVRTGFCHSATFMADLLHSKYHKPLGSHLYWLYSTWSIILGFGQAHPPLALSKPVGGVPLTHLWVVGQQRGVSPSHLLSLP